MVLSQERVALERVLERVALEQVASAALPRRGSSVRRGRPQAEAQRRTPVPEEVVSAVEGLAVLAEAGLVAGLVAGLAVLAEAVAGLVVLGVLAAVTVLTTVQLAPLESRVPACF